MDTPETSLPPALAEIDDAVEKAQRAIEHDLFHVFQHQDHLRLPDAFRMVLSLRKMDRWSESDLALQFLALRHANLDQQKRRIPAIPDSIAWLRRYLDLFRAHLINTITLFRAIFPTPPQKSSAEDVIHAFLFTELREMMASITQILPLVPREEALQLLQQDVTHLADAFARFGCDFSALLWQQLLPHFLSQ